MTVLDKTIKLWKVFERSLRVVAESNHSDGQRQIAPPSSVAGLKLPRMGTQDNNRHSDAAESLLERACLSHQLHFNKLGWRDLCFRRRLTHQFMESQHQ